MLSNSTSTAESFSLSLHDALPISVEGRVQVSPSMVLRCGHASRSTVKASAVGLDACPQDRKSQRLNSSHRCILYAVFCLKKKILILRVSMLSKLLLRFVILLLCLH